MLQSRSIFLVNTLQSNAIVTVGAIPNCHGFRDLSEIFAPWPFYVALSLICLFLFDFSLRNKKVSAELSMSALVNVVVLLCFFVKSIVTIDS
jgi:hypothetical protein